MAAPAVSAVITSHNEERYLGAAIESVLAQTHPPSEVIVVDNGSEDASVAIASGFGPPVRVVAEPERGICPVRNTGLREAAGELIGFLDGDDLWEPRKTEAQLAALAADPGLDYVLGHVAQFLSPDRVEEVAGQVEVDEAPKPGQFMGAMLAPRRTWERVGPWSESWTIADGLAWFLRAGTLGMRSVMLDDVVVRRRVHGENGSIRHRDRRTEFAQALKSAIDARRSASAD